MKKWLPVFRPEAVPVVQKAFGLLLVFGVVVGSARAVGPVPPSAQPPGSTPPSAQPPGAMPSPEIDPGSLAGALTLMSGGLLILTARRRDRVTG